MPSTDQCAVEAATMLDHGVEILAFMPRLHRADYFTEPTLQELADKEHTEPGYCSRVDKFRVGHKRYGSVMFFGETDVRWLDLNDIIQFGMREVTVYGKQNKKPPVGYGLNKPAEVALYYIQCRNKTTGELVCQGPELKSFEERLKRKTEEQGAEFVSYDPSQQEWKFQVKHFSRFGLDDSEDEEEPANNEEERANGALVNVNEDMLEDAEAGDLEEVTENAAIWQPEGSDVLGEIETEGSPMQDIQAGTGQTTLAHSLPLHLRLDPLKMQQMRTLFFSSVEESEERVLPRQMDRVPLLHPDKIAADNILGQSIPGHRSDVLSPAEDSPTMKGFSKHFIKVSPQATWNRSPNHFLSPFSRQPQLELQQEVSSSKHSRLLLSLEGKSDHLTFKKSRIGFKNELSSESCMFGRSNNIVDAALFLGSSFRVGWGPHGLLAHSGNPVGGEGGVSNGISSLICLEKVALDRSARDEQGKARDDLVELQFISPLNLHITMSRMVDWMDEQPSKMRLRYVSCDRVQLPSVCSKYEDLIVKQHAVEGLSVLQRLVLRHQVMVWHLLSVLFSDKLSGQAYEVQDVEDEGNIDEMKVVCPSVDHQMDSLVRRAEFSSWLQDSVRNTMQEELMSLEFKDQLKEIFSLLTGRQLDDAVQIAAARGDVRLACLLSQAGSSMVTRKDIALQLEIWTDEGLDFSLIEKDRVQLYKLLSGDVEGALIDREIDWKRFLGLLMWYHLAPDTQLPNIIKAYSMLIEKHTAPQPIPMYVEEGALHGIPILNVEGLYDTAYYLMLLHADQEQNAVDVHKMFSSFSSTYDPLDHRMAWLQNGLLQSIGVLSPLQLHVLDMNFVSQLLSVGQCHWAIYVALHMPPNLDYPGLHERVVKEILNQYCEVWSTDELQQSFLEKELGVPAEWLHEALGTFWQYRGNLHKALKHLLKSAQWHRAHLVFMVSVAASLFLTGQHEELVELASYMERNKMELDNWDVSGGIYARFFVLKNAFHNNDFVPDELGSFESRASSCKVFFQHMKESRSLWESQWSSENRVVYTRMADELVSLLLAESKAKVPYDSSAELKLYNIVMDAPVPEDVHLCRLQGAVSAFTSWLLETESR